MSAAFFAPIPRTSARADTSALADGTTHVRFDPLELLERLAVLRPRPRVNLILYSGVLAARAAWRAAIVPVIADGVDACEEAAPEDGNASCAQRSRAGAYQWAELMRWTFGLDVLACTRCGGRLRLVALIDQTSVIQRILRHLGLPSNVPEPRPARPPPRPLAPIEDQSQDAPEFDPAWRVWRRAGKDVGSKRCRFPCDAFSLAMFSQAAAKSRPTAVSSALSKGGGAEQSPRRSVPLTARRP